MYVCVFSSASQARRVYESKIVERARSTSVRLSIHRRERERENHNHSIKRNAAARSMLSAGSLFPRSALLSKPHRQIKRQREVSLTRVHRSESIVHGTLTRLHLVDLLSTCFSGLVRQRSKNVSVCAIASPDDLVFVRTGSNPATNRLNRIPLLLVGSRSLADCIHHLERGENAISLASLPRTGIVEERVRK